MSKLNKKDFIFADHQNEELTKLPGQINGNSFVCRKLTDCIVYLCDYNSTIYIDNCVNSNFYLGPTEASVFMRNCQNCSLTAAAEQIRVSDSTNITVHAFSLTDLALENAHDIKLAPYNFAYNGIHDHFSKLGFDKATNNGFFVHDFTPGKGNYDVLPPNEFKGKVVKALDDFETEPDCPVEWPIHFGGEVDVDVFATREIKDSVVNDDGSVSFQINVSAQDAQQKVNDQFSMQTDTIPNVDYTYTEDSETIRDAIGTNLRAQQNPPITGNNDTNNNNQPQFTKKNNYIGDIEQEEENTEHISTLEKELKQRNNKLNVVLDQKHKDEIKHKEERKRKAKIELDNFVSKYKAEIAETKAKNATLRKQKNQSGNQDNSWLSLQDNLSLKQSDYKGTRDLVAMRRAIKNKINDVTKTNPQD